MYATWGGGGTREVRKRKRQSAMGKWLNERDRQEGGLKKTMLDISLPCCEVVLLDTLGDFDSVAGEVPMMTQ